MKILHGIDRKLLLLSVFLFIAGLLMIYSSSNVTAYMLNEASPGRYFAKELLFLGTGSILSLIVFSKKTKSYYFWSSLLVLIDIALIFFLALYGTIVNGAQGWLGYNGFGIQPSEFIKVLIIPFYAMYYEKFKESNTNVIKMFFPFAVSLVITFLIIMQNDYGTAFIFLIISVVLFLLSPACKKYKIYFVVLGILVTGLGALVLFLAGDKLLDADKIARFNYSNPCEKYLTTGNQLCNGYIAINSGGIFGKGFGNSTQKYLYLPEAHTDFIFAIIIEELGIVGGIILLILYSMLILEIIHVGKRSLTSSHQLICFGVAVYILIHIIINIGGVLGLIPVTGIPLPFMSYGGSFCWSTIAALTLVQRVNYETKQKKLR